MMSVVAADGLRTEPWGLFCNRTRACVSVTWNPCLLLVEFIFLFFLFVFFTTTAGGEEFERKKTDRAPDAYAHGE